MSGCFWQQSGVSLTQDISSFKKVAVLTALTILVGGAEISSAATIFQSQNYGPLQGPDSSTSLSYNLFDPSLGTLSSVTLDFAGQFSETNGVNFTGNLDVNATILFTVIGTGNGSVQNVTGSSTANGAAAVAAFTGLGTFPADFHYQSACGPGIATCGTGWSGSLDITYNFTPSTPAETPLPSALPLFATGLGALGLVGWRRKRKAAALAA
jgi:hypothetical protein